VIGGAERLAKPRCGVPADGEKPVSQAGSTEMPDSVEALTDRDGHRHCLRFTSQRGEFLDQLVGLGTLDVEAHYLPFYPLLLPGYHPLPLPGEPVLQVRITLLDVAEPPVWRRVLVPAALSLDRVHRVIQAAMGWQNYHMHVFRVGELGYGPDPEGMLGHLEEAKVRLADVAGVGERIGYEYDFGDSWEHELLIEACTKAEAHQTYPACTAGEGACPPEDSGGFPGYQRLKEILADPSSNEYEEMRTWAESQTCGKFDPAIFDLAKASARVSTA